MILLVACVFDPGEVLSLRLRALAHKIIFDDDFLLMSVRSSQNFKENFFIRTAEHLDKLRDFFILVHCYGAAYSMRSNETFGPLSGGGQQAITCNPNL